MRVTKTWRASGGQCVNVTLKRSSLRSIYQRPGRTKVTDPKHQYQIAPSKTRYMYTKQSVWPCDKSHPLPSDRFPNKVPVNREQHQALDTLHISTLTDKDTLSLVFGNATLYSSAFRTKVSRNTSLLAPTNAWRAGHILSKRQSVPTPLRVVASQTSRILNNDAVETSNLANTTTLNYDPNSCHKR